MKIIRIISYFLFWPFFLISCSPGYKKTEGKWAYVTYDEGNGKNVKYIDVDESTFKILSDNRYAKDKTKVFFEGDLIKTAESKSFSIISGDYSADEYQVYLKNYIIIEADPKTFKRLKSFYARDQKHIFSGTVPLRVTDIEHFKITKRSDSYGFQPVTAFIKEYPVFAHLDTSKYEYVIFGHDKGQTLTEQFEGHKILNKTPDSN
jgi:hypothetical protein